MNDEETTQLSEFDKASDDPLLMSDYEHKAFLVRPIIKKDIAEPDDLLPKDLQLSFIDRQLAFIYSTKLTASEEWRSMGMRRLAKRRLVHIVAKLSLLKSIDGFERILQSGTGSLNAQMELGTSASHYQQMQPQEERSSFGGLKKILRR